MPTMHKCQLKLLFIRYEESELIIHQSKRLKISNGLLCGNEQATSGPKNIK